MKTVFEWAVRLVVATMCLTGMHAFASGKPSRKAAPVAATTAEESPAVRDERVRSVIFRADEVVRLQGAYGYALAVEFGTDEIIAAVSLGDSVAWQAVQRRNVLFLKPQDERAETNLLVHTNLRSYSFSLRAFRANGASDPRLTYRVRFRYPDDEAREEQARAHREGLILAREMKTIAGGETATARDPNALPASRARTPVNWNFNYSFKGDKAASPVQMLDDGEFTYIRFVRSESIPAIFMVDKDGSESLLNYRREGEWLVIERLARRFTFRASNNTEVACIYNDGFPERPPTQLSERT